MKTLLPILVISLLGVNCSTESTVDSEVGFPLEHSALMASSPMDVEGMEFDFRSDGLLLFRGNSQCSDLPFEVQFAGTGMASQLGSFEVYIRGCTNFRSGNELSGVQVDPEGDRLFFRSIRSGQDHQGADWTEFTYSGGTGKYLNARGMLRLYSRVSMIADGQGVCAQSGIGRIVF